MALVMSARGAPILARQPERVLVEGCRTWIAGFATRCIDCWDIGWDMCAREVGARDARRLSADLFAFVRVANAATDRPILTMSYGCSMLSRDECLLLAAVAGQQNADRASAFAAARHLAGEGADTVAAAAGLLAAALQQMHQHLLPVPRFVVEDVAGRPPLGCYH